MTVEQARQLRKLLEKQTESMTDEEILDYPCFVEKWQADTDYVVDKRVCYNDVIYKCLQVHTSQSTWTPDVSSSLFARVLIPYENVIPDWQQTYGTNT